MTGQLTGELTGQVGIVTGGGRGIGRAVALALAAQGMAVAALARSGGEVRTTVEACEAYGPPALGLVADVTDPDALGRLLPQVEQRLGPVDLLVNCAGVGDPQEAPLWDLDVERTWSVIETNLGGPLRYCATLLPDMVRRRHGRIVNINSLDGARPAPRATGYAVSKAALSRLTDCLHAALAGTGVSVFDLSPGLVRTAMTAGLGRWADVPAAGWVPAERTGDLVVLLAAGRLDALAGRFLHATDDPAVLLARAEQIVKADARVLRLVPYGEDDPLFAD